jgi:Domain of unknown function (DUF1905)
MATASFRAALKPSGRGGGHLVEVPPRVIEALGGKGRIPVTATFNGVPYRGSIVRMGGGAVLGVQKAIIAEAGVSVGDTLRIAVSNDDAAREVGLPEELAKAFRRNRAAPPVGPSARSSSCWRMSADRSVRGQQRPRNVAARLVHLGLGLEVRVELGRRRSAVDPLHVDAVGTRRIVPGLQVRDPDRIQPAA